MKKISVYFLGFLILLIVSGCSTTGQRVPPQVYNENSLKDICLRRNIIWRWDGTSQVVALRYQDVEAKVLLNSNMVLFGKEKVYLSSPLMMRNSIIFVPADFMSKVIDRMLAKTKMVTTIALFPSGKIRQIIIDAGHGGKDPGAIGRHGTREKDIVLDIAKRFKKIIQRQGIKVIMTRDSDEFISLPERTEIASRSNADLFVSIHANSSPMRSVNGIEVYSVRELGYDEKSEAQRKTNHHLMFRNFKMKQNDPDLEETLADMLYNYKKAESDSLGENFVDDTCHYVRARKLGLKYAHFYVLRNTLIPAVLVEVGFLTNPKEEALLKTGAYRQRLASGLAQSILDYGHSQ